MRLLLPLAIFILAHAAPAADSLDLAPVKKWIARQDDLRSVQADFTQTRALKALRSPVATPGRLTFAAPDRLRWELGDPARTIVIRNGSAYWIIQPARKKAERLSASSIREQGGAKGFGMMEFPLAADFADFQRKFEILDVQTEGATCHLEILPHDPQAQKFLRALKIDFDTKTGHMLSFEMITREGSSMRNDFSNVRMNEKIDLRVFDYDLTGFEVADEKK